MNLSSVNQQQFKRAQSAVAVEYTDRISAEA